MQNDLHPKEIELINKSIIGKEFGLAPDSFLLASIRLYYMVMEKPAQLYFPFTENAETAVAYLRNLIRRNNEFGDELKKQLISLIIRYLRLFR